MEAGYSGTPLQKKLGMKPGHKVAYVKAPARFAEQFCDVRVLARLRYPLDVIVLFATSERDLIRRLPPARRALVDDGGLWVAWPKRASGVATAIDETWSGLRFVYRLTARGTPRTG